MKNLCILTSNSLKNYGGGEKYIINLGNGLFRKNVDITVIALKYFQNQRVNDDDLRNMIKFNYTEIDYKSGFLKPLQAKKIPEIIDDNLYVMSGYYMFIKQSLNIKGNKTYGAHDPSLENPDNILKKRILTELIPKFDSVHILNEPQRKYIKNKNIKLLHLTWLGEKMRFEQKFNKFSIIFYGRHEEDKGINTILNIAKILNNDIDLYIVGAGSKSYLFNDIKKQNIKVLGFLEENKLYDLITKCHAVIFPSYSEVYSAISYESMACHTPLIYRNINANEFLNYIDFEKICNNDDDFIRNILSLKKLYDTDREEYIKKCRELDNYLMSSDEYLKSFINFFIQ